MGLVTNSAKLPVGRATVTAARVTGGGLRATVSNSDGTYSFSDLPPGAWTITSQIDGFPPATVPSIDVVANKATRYDIVMAGAPAAPAAPALAAATAAPPVQTVSLGLQAPDASDGVDNFTPFAFGDFTWLNGSPRNHQPAFDTKFFTPDIRLDASFIEEQAHPKDHTIVGSTEAFRSGEFQLEQVSFGGDFHWDNVRARFLSMFGMFATTTPRSPSCISSATSGSVSRSTISAPAIPR